MRPVLAAIKGFTDRSRALILCEKQLKLERGYRAPDTIPMSFNNFHRPVFLEGPLQPIRMVPGRLPRRRRNNERVAVPLRADIGQHLRQAKVVNLPGVELTLVIAG